MYSKIVFNVFLVFLLTVFQVAFVGSLPGILSAFNLILVFVVYVLAFSGLEYAFLWGVIAGVLLDFFSFYAFGAHLISFFLTILIVNFLLENFFTNRSLYSFLALGFVASVFFKFFIYLWGAGIYFFIKEDFDFIMNASFFKSELKILFMNLIFVFMLFYLYNMFSSKLKLSFLLKNRGS